MKITNFFLGKGPQTSFNKNYFTYFYIHVHIDINNQIKINQNAAPLTYTLNAVVCKNMNKKSYGKSCPASLLNQSTFRSPPYYFFFKFFFVGENKYSGLGIPKNKFSGRAYTIED